MIWWEDFRTGDTMEMGRHRWEAVNQAGELVLTMEGWGLFGRKN
jgi:hypothetical protein